MNILDISLLGFCTLEILNIIILFFKPDFKYGNSLAVFKSFMDNKNNENLNLFHKYLTNWVASCKVIFIVLIAVIVFYTNDKVKIITLIAVIFSISLYYFSLFPILKKLANKNELNDPKYPNKLTKLITLMIALLLCAILIYVINFM